MCDESADKKHIQSYQKCEFMKLKNGESFIQSVLDGCLESRSKTHFDGKAEGETTSVKNNQTNACIECKICLDRRADIMLLTCGHLCMCVQCLFSLNKKICPVCREEAKDTFKVFY
jgi:hypothetical protein